MEAAPSFPLYRLPTKVIVHFLRILNFQEMIAIASLSQKSKSLCKTANHKARVHWAAINIFIYIVVAQHSDLTIFQCQYELEHPQLTTPTKVSVRRLSDEKEKEWGSLEIDLIFEFLEGRSFWQLRFEQGCEQLDLEVVKQKFQPFEKLDISHNVNNEYSRRILAEMVQDAETLSCSTNPYQNPEDFQKFLVQNLQEFEGNLTLNELLVCNSSVVSNSTSFIRTNLSEKNINRFLKLWTNGANRNLKTIINTVGQGLNAHEILRGLSYREFPSKQKRTVERAYPGDNQEVFGGFDIWRVDGTKGTIFIDARKMIFHVWG